MKVPAVSSMVFWSHSVEEVVTVLETDVKNGLTDDEVAKRKKEFGSNDVEDAHVSSDLVMLARQFKSPLIIILLLAAGATFFLKEWFDASIIILAILVNAVLGFYQENKAENAISHLRSFIKVRVRVIRNGKELEVNAKDVVPGDLVHLTLGSRVPADGRIISERNLRIDEAVLTGESLPVSKHSNVLPEATLLADRVNMAFGGTLVAEGNGLMIVTGTAMNTEFGKIANLVGVTKKEQTPIQKSVAELSWIITILASLLVVVVFGLGISRGESFVDMFLISVAVAVGSIPEALPIGLTAVLAVGVERLAKRKGIMRNLTAAETLGSTTVVMTDKTGTLTEAKLQLVDILTVNNIRQHHVASVTDSLSLKQKDLLHVAAMGSDVIVENPNDEIDMWRVAGSSLEATILKNAAKYKVASLASLTDQKRKVVIPFNSKNKFSVCESLLDLQSDLTSRKKGYAQIIIGAPDILLKRSTLSKDDYLTLLESIEKYSLEGRRMVGVAVSYLNKAGQTHGRYKPDEIKDIEFIGLLSFFDPVRKEVPEAIKKIEKFGVRVVIATGDLPGTAMAVARQLGWEIKESEVLTGDAIGQMDDSELRDSLSHVKIFARVAPKDKLRVAKLFQSRGEVIAMTGDGVNDAPSLKAVDIGIAVGSGSDVSKGVADLVLLDDNFNTIVAAIEEGKRVLKNIRKTFVYLMSSSLDEVILIGGSLLLAIPLPLTAVQIIWVNFFTGSLPAIAFAFDKDIDEAHTKKQHKDKIINSEVRALTTLVAIITSGVLFLLYYLLLKTDFDLLMIKTFVFVCFASYILFISYSFRNLQKSIFYYNPFSNQLLNVGVVVGLVLLLATVYVPFLQTVFHTTALNAIWLVGIFAWVAGNMLFVETIKWFFYRK